MTINVTAADPRDKAPTPRVSKPPHPADGMTVGVDCGDGATMEIADPRCYGGLLDRRRGPVWTMTWGDPASIRHTVASLLSSYDYLLGGDITGEEAIRRLRLMRAARKACATEAAAIRRGDVPPDGEDATTKESDMATMQAEQGDAYQTDTMMFAFRDGRPVACGWKQEGPGGRKWTAKTVAAWAAEGLEIKMMHRDEPGTEALHEQVWGLVRA